MALTYFLSIMTFDNFVNGMNWAKLSSPLLQPGNQSSGHKPGYRGHV